ncbi:MAG: hypothetical protein ABI723_26385 [Bacteroidia bacterium]
MKKNLLLFCLIAFAMFASPSCKKCDLPKKAEAKAEAQIVTIELKKNETCHYALPQNFSGRICEITKQAQHFSVSELATNQTYTYTPAINYIGTDQVTISTVEEQNNNNNNCGSNHHGGNNNNGNCGSHDETKSKQTIIINFIIKGKEGGKHYAPITCPSF